MVVSQRRPARAPLVQLCLVACAQAWMVGPVRAQELRSLESPRGPQATGTAKGNASPGADAGVRQRLRVEIAQPGNSAREELGRAIQRLPLAQLSAADRQRVSEIVRAPTLYRRLPTITCQTDPRVYSYFVTNPDVAVSIWRVMGVSDMQMRQVAANEYETDLNDGTVGIVQVLHRSANCQLVLCAGDFKSPLLARPIRSTGLMCLQTKYWQAPDGYSYITHTADVFVLFHSDAVEAIAKLISPMSFKMADRNFEEVTLFVRMMDEAMSREPGWVERTAGRMQGVIPGRDRELLDVAAQVYVDAQRRALQQAGASVTLEALRPPVQTAEGD